MANNALTQINEFLKRRGLLPQQGDKHPFFDLRKQLFGQMGQTDKFIGSENQNAFMQQGLQKAEKNVGVKITPDNIFDVIGAGVSDVATQTQALQERVRTEGITGLTPPPLPQPDQPIAPAVTETTPADLLPEPISGEEFLPEIPTGEQLATQALEQIQTGAAFPLQLEAEEAKKTAVQLGAQRETESFIRDIASRGLFFSGAKAAGVSQIEADKLADLLNIDRSFALLMVQGLETAARDIAQQAAKGRQEAIDALETLGYAINPLTGKVEPTLAARKAVVTEERLAGVEERQERQFQLSVAKAGEQARQFGVSQARMFTQFQTAQAATQSRFEATQALNEAKYNLSIAKTQAQITQANERIRISEERLDLAIEKERRSAMEDKPFLNTNWFLQSYGEDALIKEAKAAGYGEIKLSGKQEMNNYLKDLMRRIESYRQAGYTDKDILKMMQ